MDTTIKKLPHQFTGTGEVRGYEFRLILESEKAYVFEKSFNGTKSYEVFKKVINKRFNTESYPTSKAFGYWVWQISDLSRAKSKFNDLNR